MYLFALRGGIITSSRRLRFILFGKASRPTSSTSWCNLSIEKKLLDGTNFYESILNIILLFYHCENEKRSFAKFEMMLPTCRPHHQSRKAMACVCNSMVTTSLLLVLLRCFTLTCGHGLQHPRSVSGLLMQPCVVFFHLLLRWRQTLRHIFGRNTVVTLPFLAVTFILLMLLDGQSCDAGMPIRQPCGRRWFRGLRSIPKATGTGPHARITRCTYAFKSQKRWNFEDFRWNFGFDACIVFFNG